MNTEQGLSGDTLGAQQEPPIPTPCTLLTMNILFWKLFSNHFQSFVRLCGFFKIIIALSIHNIKLIISTILSVQLSGIKYVHDVVQSSPQSMSRTSLSFETETLYPLNTNPSRSFPVLGNHHSTFYLYQPDSSRHQRQVESYSICSFWLPYCTQHIFKVHPCCIVCLNFLLSKAE